MPLFSKKLYNRESSKTSPLWLLLAAFLSAFSIAASAHAATYYVSASGGSDSNPGTEAAPFKTILRGSKSLNSGDTLYIKAGTYDERMVNGINDFRFVNGTASAYTRYAAAPGDEGKVIISPGPEGYNNFTVFFGNNSYIEMSGLVLDNSRTDDADRYLVKFGDYNSHQMATNIRFKGNELRNARIGIGNGGGNEIIGNYFHDLRGYGIYTMFDNGLLEGNTFQNIGGYAIHHFQQDGAKAPDNWVIRNNVITNSGKTYISPHGDKPHRPLPAAVIARGTGTQFYNNIIYDSYAGLQVGLGAKNTLIANNTIYGNGLFGIDIQGRSDNAHAVNNIVYGNRDVNLRDQGTNTTLEGNLTTDPKFVNAAAGDFGVLDGSPAIDKGITVAQVPNDFTGKARPEAAAYDIGAFEGAGSKADAMPDMSGGLPGGGGRPVLLGPNGEVCPSGY